MAVNKVEAGFSRYAATYDAYAAVQADIGRTLLRDYRYSAANTVLELGCGTGNYTAMLREKFPGARIVAMDISRAMLEVAAKKNIPGVDFLRAEAESFTSRERFDLITSNACLQWVGDLKCALARYKGLIAPGGMMTFSTFGPRTFYELASVLRSFDKSHIIPAETFLPRGEVERIAGDIFPQSEVKVIVIEKNFNDLNSFLRSVKYSGTHGFGLGEKKSLTRLQLKKLEGRYRDEFKQIVATYEVFLCRLNV